ncbi:dihydrolipoamide acyltransferase [Sphingopyxis sp. Root214]|uniref:biotin/lipoyl-containing protein n=1 Tax=unclassified Sphingopyxis TaxID=2614943 RepID=UPI0006F6C9AF|nr:MULTISPECIES: lipoyl domain-containing protein [unclassified Sphingopyxis]KQZ73762.1 dihydrolipoamide acyltransferase [Sphingopyxis sp. Root154]KRC07903.1 dihydrolipoamide acyltransferase [Sphingopyxis sp. Root214]
MKTEICIPGLGAGMAEGTITEWHIADGGEVKEGDILYTLESEKTALDVEAPVAGVLRQVGKAGEVYEVGAVVAFVES